jgi:hypothetical protein
MKKFIKDLGSELEECPFCKKYNLKYACYMSGGVIECEDCGAMGPEVLVDPSSDDIIADAIKSWNDRKGKP